MSRLIAVVAQYRSESVQVTSLGITTVCDVMCLHFDKIFQDGLVVPCAPSWPAEKIVAWLEREGYVRAGAVIGEGERERLGCFWILSAEYHAGGKRPEDFAKVLGQPVYSATVAFYPSDGERPARLDTEVRAGAIKAARARRPNAQGDLGVQKVDPDRLLKTMGLIL